MTSGELEQMIPASDEPCRTLLTVAALTPTHSAGVQYCGAPYASPGSAGSTSQPNPGSANATDQYVPKHFPFPWFQSILQSGDCNLQHIANLFDSTDGLYHDLQSEATTPAFSWISPNNCSDAHDAVCHGNNLSGGFSDRGEPRFLVRSCHSAHTTKPTRRALPGTVSGARFAGHVPLGRSASLHRFRRPALGVVQRFPRYYRTVRLLTIVHHEITA
jgi:hypothetical protein